MNSVDRDLFLGCVFQVLGLLIIAASVLLLVLSRSS